MLWRALNRSSAAPYKVCLVKIIIINLQNKDDQCFKWAVTRALNPGEVHEERIDTKLIEKAKELNWNGIEFPAGREDISTFERQNETVSINVYGYEKGTYPLRISKYTDERKSHVDLMLISNDDKIQHYCWIKNFSRLMCGQATKHKGTRFYCKRCLNGFLSTEKLAVHKEYCKEHPVVRRQLPIKPKPDKPGNNILEFKHLHMRMRVPFVIYADFEAFTKPIDTCQPDPATSYTMPYQKHVASSFAFYVKCFDDKIYKPKLVTYTAADESDDVAQIFVDRLEEEIRDIYNRVDFNKPMIFTEEDQEVFDKSINCHICGGEFGRDEDKDKVKVRDHCHLSGKFRGAAHNKCNLNYRIPKFIPIFFHNMSNYDAHLFIKRLVKPDEINNTPDTKTYENINCIAKNEESYITFGKQIVVGEYTDKYGMKLGKTTCELKFVDSFRFMSSSLEALVKNLDRDQCKNLKKFYGERHLDLLKRKGVYPYDYVDSVDKLANTSLPPKEAFYSKLNDEDISVADYEHAKTVWREFSLKTLGEYHELYNSSHVLLLADVFETCV